MNRRAAGTTKPYRIPGLLALVLAFGMMNGCGHHETDTPDGDIVSSRAYKGHASDADVNNFVQTYTYTRATRLDDCQTCHKGGTAETVDKAYQDKKAKTFNPCDYCHLIFHHEGYTGYPTTYAETLNAYGTAYNHQGRNRNALAAIANADSDEDGHTNVEEIQDLRYPGDAGSYPGLALCAMREVTMAEIKALPAHTQFGLGNTTKQQFDFYATYKGVKIIDLLDDLGIDLTGATSVDILAPDGYAKSFSLDEIRNPFPAHKFFTGFGVEDLGADCAFVEYPAQTYGYGYGETITDAQWHILAYEREGLPLEETYLDVTVGKIYGEGPFRNVIPPGSEEDAMNQPDRGKYADTTGCTMPQWNYDNAKDHNAGSMVKGTVIIRIQPMPEGCEEFDIQNGGWALINDKVIYVYGHNVNP